MIIVIGTIMLFSYDILQSCDLSSYDIFKKEAEMKKQNCYWKHHEKMEADEEQQGPLARKQMVVMPQEEL